MSGVAFLRRFCLCFPYEEADRRLCPIDWPCDPASCLSALRINDSGAGAAAGPLSPLSQGLGLVNSDGSVALPQQTLTEAHFTDAVQAGSMLTSASAPGLIGASGSELYERESSSPAGQLDPSALTSLSEVTLDGRDLLLPQFFSLS